MKNRINMARNQLTKLKRFNRLSPKIQIHLYKALVKPIMVYPIIPCCLASNTNISKMQALQNKAIRGAIKEDENLQELSIEDLHQYFKLEPMNIRLHRLASKAWDRLAVLDEGLVQQSTEENENHNQKDHVWWPRIACYVNSPEPQPIFLRN